jgi:N-acetylneuraminic acid mutarotase
MRVVPLFMIALSSVMLAACGDTTTEPSRVGAPGPGTPDFAVTSNTWTTRRDLPYARWDLAVADAPNAAGQSILYAIGGRTATGAPLGRVQAYNVATNTWTWKSDMPRPLSSTNGAGVINGKIYVSGGFYSKLWSAAGSITGSLFVYDPATNTWTQKRSMPQGGAWGVTGVINGKLYVVTTCIFADESTNWYSSCDQSNLYRYNPATDRWATLPRPKGVYMYGIGGVLYDKLYVTDGKNTEVYDPVTNLWTSKRLGPQYRYEAAAAVVHAKLYVTGGRGINAAGEWETWRTTSVYHPLTDTWTTAAPLPTARSGIAATRVFLNGRPRLEVVGGGLPGNNLQYIP